MSHQPPLPAADLPTHCDVLVVGAGPAGSACARVLAQAGRDVVLIDAQAFPRDKICGDALVPDAHAALRRLGLHAQVMALALPVTHANCVAPAGHAVDVHGELAVLPRKQLDALLCRAAADAGAHVVAPAHFDGVEVDAQGRVVGAQVRLGTNRQLVQAQWVVLATGAGAGPLLAAGVCTRRTPSGLALRAYVHHPQLSQEISALRFTWHRQLPGGYGWVFPGPDDTFNIGVALLDNYADAPPRWRPWARRRSGLNLRELFARFQAIDPVAGRLMREGTARSELKGAPFRCDLGGAEWARPGLLVTGEAAGSTYSFTGEGIGKALETGIAAADALLSSSIDAQICESYRQALTRLIPRYRNYRRAGSFSHHPWVANVAIARARSSARLQAKLADVLAERRLPPNGLLNWRVIRALLRP